MRGALRMSFLFLWDELLRFLCDMVGDEHGDEDEGDE
jgi:hypothetical protein